MLQTMELSVLVCVLVGGGRGSRVVHRDGARVVLVLVPMLRLMVIFLDRFRGGPALGDLILCRNADLVVGADLNRLECFHPLIKAFFAITSAWTESGCAVCPSQGKESQGEVFRELCTEGGVGVQQLKIRL